MHKAPAGAKQPRTFRIYRFDPDSGENPRVDTYEVDMASCGPMVLDALIKIKNEIDPTLSFRRSCREGICGSCAMNIDGVNTLACTRACSEVKHKEVRIYPLAAYAGGEGLGARPHAVLCAVRGGEALAEHAFAAAARQRTLPVERGSGEDRPALGLHSVRLLFHVLPELLWNSDRYLGPAALLAAYRWIIDSRDDATGERLDALEDPFRLYRCHTIMNCTEACPKGPESRARDFRHQADVDARRN